jgi:hypothetical protein
METAITGNKSSKIALSNLNTTDQHFSQNFTVNDFETKIVPKVAKRIRPKTA